MSQCVRVLLVLVMLDTLNANKTEPLPERTMPGCVLNPPAPRTICLKESDCKDNCRGQETAICHKTDAIAVQNLLILTNGSKQLAPSSVTDSAFVCGDVDARQWIKLTINDNGTNEKHEYFTDSACKGECKFGCEAVALTDHLIESLASMKRQGLHLYACKRIPWWVWLLVALGGLQIVLLILCTCLCYCCCCRSCPCFGCFGCCGDNSASVKTKAANTAHLESDTARSAPTKNDTVVNVVTTPLKSPPREPSSRRSSRSSRSSSRHRSSSTQHSQGSGRSERSRRQLSPRDPYDRTMSSLSMSDSGTRPAPTLASP